MSSSAVSDPDRSPAPRATYHHGDLRRALLEASLELAREGGPDAVVLREATRRVGVSANAAYRHFADRDALLAATASLAQARGADVIAATMAEAGGGDSAERSDETPGESRPDESDAGGSSAEARSLARARFRAVGVGYLRFAMNEPGLFRTAFAVPTDLRRSAAPEAAGECGRTPFQLLSDTLDEMLEAGVLPASERPGAELLAWSAVHGLAMLALEGPLRELPPTFIDELAPRLVRMVDLGLGVLSGGDEPRPGSKPDAPPPSDPVSSRPGEPPSARGRGGLEPLGGPAASAS